MSGASQEHLDDLATLGSEIVRCRRCPRLVAWREQVALKPRASFAGQRYAAHPLPGFGDPHARVALLGLAPAAHGGNRTGRIFTGDRSGDFLFASLYRTAFANQPTSTGLDDGLQLHDAWVTAAVRCAPPANKPTPAERDSCLPWSARELALLPELRVIVCLGAFAWDAALRLRAELADEPVPRPRPRFAHGAEDLCAAGATVQARRSEGHEQGAAPPALLGCFHPSQQNTFTGRLTAPMIDAVFLRARELAAR